MMVRGVDSVSEAIMVIDTARGVLDPDNQLVFYEQGATATDGMFIVSAESSPSFVPARHQVRVLCAPGDPDPVLVQLAKVVEAASPDKRPLAPVGLPKAKGVAVTLDAAAFPPLAKPGAAAPSPTTAAPPKAAAGPRKGKKNFYAVAYGRKEGVYTTWAEAEEQVKAFPGAYHAAYETRAGAEAWLAHPLTKAQVQERKEKAAAKERGDGTAGTAAAAAESSAVAPGAGPEPSFRESAGGEPSSGGDAAVDGADSEPGRPPVPKRTRKASAR